MRYLFGASDEKFIRVKKLKSSHDINPLEHYKFRGVAFFATGRPFIKHDVPIVFKTSPDTLLNLCSNLVDSFKLPSVYEWSNKDVCNWIFHYGYHHYQNTFRENMITGRKLLLIDASALAAMNIKNFKDIMHIAYGIRQLFYFEMTKFMHSIALPPEYSYELYKVFMAKTGHRYDRTRRSDLWRQIRLLRPKVQNLSHWDLLERWLRREPESEIKELFGGAPRRRLDSCKPAPPKPRQSSHPISNVLCTCIPPCTCFWTEQHLQPPTVFSILNDRKPDPDFRHKCEGGVPPCTCHWPSRKFKFGTVLTCLQMAFPHRYGPLRYNAPRFLHTSTISVNDY